MATTWAVTNNTQFSQVIGSERMMDVTLVGTGTYTTGGDTVTAAALGLDVIDFIIPVIDGNGANTNGVAVVAPNLGSSPGATSVKLQLFGTGGGSGQTLAEVGNATTVTGITIRARVFGAA